MRRESTFLSVSAAILLLHLLLPIHLPPTFHALSRHHTPTLESLLTNLPNAATTPLHESYKKFSRCGIDLPALRKALSRTTAPQRNFVICVSRPLTKSFLHFITTLSKRLGTPYITSTDPHILSTLAFHNITPVLPSSPDEALITLSTAANLLISAGIPCAFGARVASGMVYYTKEYHDFMALHGYEWLPENSARLDGYDRSYRAILAAVGKVDETCCNFRNGICHPLPNGCRAIVMGELKESVGCKTVHACRKGPCPPWAQLVKARVPDVLVLDLKGREFDVLKQITATRRLPKQIVFRMRVRADVEIGEGWVKGKQGWVVKRDVVIDVVDKLRKSGFRLVHRVDDPGCEWCSFVTFLRE